MQIKDFETLANAQAHEVEEGKLISAETMRIFIIKSGLYAYFKNNSSDLQMAAYDNLQSGGEFNFINSDSKSIAGLFDAMIAGDTDYSAALTNLKSLCVSESNAMIQPFLSATLSQFNAVKGVYTAKSINHVAGKDIVMILNADLTEKVAATLWRVESGFIDENAGRNSHIETANKYRIDMSGIKSGNYEVRIPFLNASFSIINT
jgi:hypothetical protein